MNKPVRGQWWPEFSASLCGTAFNPARIQSLHEVATGTDVPGAPRCPKKLVYVDIGKQLLQLIIDGNISTQHPVSTSKHGSGCRQDTGCTPLGWHRVAEKIGDGAPAGTIFKGRRAGGVAECLQSDATDDLITSRILWLQGLQHGFNHGGQVDSKNRYIYIHGTAQEHLLGLPVSAGCIRMANADVVSLFDRVDIDTPLYIG